MTYKYKKDELFVLNNPTPRSLWEMANRFVTRHNAGWYAILLSRIVKKQIYGPGFGGFDEEFLKRAAQKRYEFLKEHYAQKATANFNDAEAGKVIAKARAIAKGESSSADREAGVMVDAVEFESVVSPAYFDTYEKGPAYHYLSPRNLKKERFEQMRGLFASMIERIEGEMSGQREQESLSRICEAMVNSEFFEEALAVINEKIAPMTFKLELYLMIANRARRIFEDSMCLDCMGAAAEMIKWCHDNGKQRDLKSGTYKFYSYCEWVATQQAFCGLIPEAVETVKLSNKMVRPIVFLIFSQSLYMKNFLQGTSDNENFMDCQLG